MDEDDNGNGELDLDKDETAFEYPDGLAKNKSNKGLYGGYNRLIIDPIRRLERISEEKTDELITRMRGAENAGNRESSINLKNEAFLGNLNRVLESAIGYFIRYKKVELSDVVNDGGIGLIRAIEKYDPENPKGASLRTYASYWINQEIRRHLGDNYVIKKSYYQLEHYKKITKAQTEISEPDSRKTFKKVSKKTGYSIGTITNVLKAEQGCKKVIPFVKAYHDRSDENIEKIVRQEESNEQKKVLQEVMQKYLSFEERQVLICRYGLCGFDEKYGSFTLQETGDTFHLSRERIRQIQKKALKKLQKSWDKEILKGLVV